MSDFTAGQHVVCIDAFESKQGPLQHMRVYVVVEHCQPFLVVEEVNGDVVRGEWHETRFVDWKEVV